ncbi:hypothetical protein BDZ94DRAFT_1269480 [Collybia nuda]|uniref:Secreted protein n=1 Tax=Collybia nuda TaxID=64659 RepID=A0A9P6CAY1_9AGAR|nr:hypothetical protein BDZ94DRAFT_1269480 [Collybia nuda]
MIFCHRLCALLAIQVLVSLARSISCIKPIYFALDSAKTRDPWTVSSTHCPCRIAGRTLILGHQVRARTTLSMIPRYAYISILSLSLNSALHAGGATHSPSLILYCPPTCTHQIR